MEAQWIETPESSHVVAVKYDPDTSELSVRLNNGRVGEEEYKYYAVPEDVWNEFLVSASKGRYLNIVLGRQYRYEKVG